MQYLPIDKDAIPYRWEIRIEEETFSFEIYYNAEHDFFTVDLSKGGEVLVYGEKIVYGRPLFSAYADPRFPKAAIIPFDDSESETRVTFDNLNRTVFLYLVTEEDLQDDLSAKD